MCGICGLIGFARGADERRGIVESMSEALQHRGPDGEGLCVRDAFALGHRRLAIIDPEGGSQPMLSEDGRYVIVFNGELYNYKELSAELVSKGIRFITKSDTEVMLRALIHWGESALSKFNGMFAFLFADLKSGRWLVARDPFGVKPFYYLERSDEFVFASEIKAFLKHPNFKAEADLESTEEYLNFQFCLGSKTLFKEVRKLEPGELLRGSEARIESRDFYWKPDYHIDESKSDEAFADELRSLLRDSLRLQVRSDVPIGAYLSGGVDSSAVSALATNELGRVLRFFHGRFNCGPAYDESRYGKKQAERLGGEFFVSEPSESDFVEFLPKLIWAMDEPVAGPGSFPQYFVSQLASKHVKVVLGGQGGDEVFGGYARYLVAYLEQALKGVIFQTQEEGKHIVTLHSLLPNLSLLQEYTPLLKRFFSEGMFDSMASRYFKLVNRLEDSEGILGREFRESFSSERMFAKFEDAFSHPDTKSYMNKMLHFDSRTLLPSLLHIEDRVSMAWGLESRVPLLDTRIVELVNSMPPKLKFKGGQTKHIFKHALEGVVDDSILNRRDKMGFPIPLNDWLRAGPVRDFAFDVFSSRKARDRGIFDWRALRRLIEEDRPFGRAVWGALSLELWHQSYIDGGS